MFATAEDLSKVIESQLQNTSETLSVFWYAVASDRENFAERLRAAVAHLPIVVLVVRTAGFDNPNAVMNDLVDLLERHRDAVLETMGPHLGQCQSCALVLLGRSQLAVAQVSSPVALPGWFPMGGGTAAHCTIVDLTWTATGPLSAVTDDVADLCERLFAIDGTVLSRLQQVYERNHSAGQHLMLLLAEHGCEGRLPEFLETAAKYRAGVTAARGFRPTTKKVQTFVGAAWRLTQGRAPEALSKPAKALAAALDVTANGRVGHESIVTVLARPTEPDPDWGRRFCRNLLVVVAAASQLITAAAHSDDYGDYPLPLLRLVVSDLRTSLIAAEQYLRADSGW